MKKHVFLTFIQLLLIVIVSTNGYAFVDNSKFGKLSIGGTFGLNMADLSIDEFDSTPEIGFSLGGFANVPIMDKISFQPEFHITMRNTSLEIKENVYYTQFGVNYLDEYKAEIDIEVIYLEVPLLGRLDIPVQDKINCFGIAGPYFSIKISESLDGKASQTIINTDTNTTEFNGTMNFEVDSVETFEWGFIIGGGVTYDKFSAQLRYNLGLSDITDDEDNKYGIFSIHFSYLF